MSAVGGRSAGEPYVMHNLAAPPLPLPGLQPDAPSPFLHPPDFQPFADSSDLLAKPVKTRRRRVSNAAGQPTTKHKRTRSGCFTCRGRRVKCDEGRPKCDRCAKGHRSCQYPDPPPSKASIAQQRRARRERLDASLAEPAQAPLPDRPESSQQYGVANQDPSSGRPIPKEDDEDDSTSSFQSPCLSAALPGDRPSQPVPRGSPDSGNNYPASPSTMVPTTSFSPIYSPTQSSTILPSSDVLLGRSHIPEDIRFYLEYYRNNICSLHYSIRDDSDDVFDSVLPTIATRDPALLHAVVSFAAYHSVVQAGDDGKFEIFLRYYNVAVQLLLQSLQKEEKPTVYKLLAILMLTTMEEYFGDWVNLCGHQKAALAMILQLYTPDSIMQTKLSRMILVWYVRFDLIISFRAGDEVALPRNWIASMVLYHQTAAVAHPHSVPHTYAVIAARLRLICMDTSILYSRRNRHETTLEQYNQDYDHIMARLFDWKNSLDQTLTDPSFLLRDLDLLPGNITGPFVPGEMYNTPRFLTSLLILEWHSCMALHYSRSENMSIPDMFAKAGVHVYGACRLFEAVEAWPTAPKGAVITLYTNVLAASFFLPPSPENHAWIRQKLALFETRGIIQARMIREKFSDTFKDESCLRWWLPDDRGYTRIVQTIRAFADERNAIARVYQPESISHITEAIEKMNVHHEEGSAEASSHVVVKQEEAGSSSPLYPRSKRIERE